MKNAPLNLSALKNTEEIAKYLRLNTNLNSEDLNKISNTFINCLQIKYDKSVAENESTNAFTHYWYGNLLEAKDYNILKKIVSRINIDNNTVVKLFLFFNKKYYNSYKITKAVRFMPKSPTDWEFIVKEIGNKLINDKTNYISAFFNNVGGNISLNDDSIKFIFQYFDNTAMFNPNNSKYHKVYFCMNLLNNKQIINFDLASDIFRALNQNYKYLALKKCNLDVVDLTRVYTKTSNRFTKDSIGEYLEKTDEGKQVMNSLGFLKIASTGRPLDLKVRRKIIKKIRDIEAV